jgi:archaellum component FlaC
MVNQNDIDYCENKLASIANTLSHCENDLKSVWICDETKYIEYAIDSMRQEIERLRNDVRDLKVGLWI